MKSMFRFLVIVAMFTAGQAMAQSTDGFSVGGVGTFGGSAVNPVTENGWGSLNDYRAARDCCGYTNSPTDAQLWTDATNADAGLTSQITNANCASATYPGLRTSCTNGGGNCQTLQRDTFLPMRDFNLLNPCLSPGYASYSAYQAAALRNFGLNQLDITLLGEADTAGWDAYCPGSDCSTANRGQFLDAKAGKSLFQSALADAASASSDGTLTWSQLIANYGSYKVDVSAPWNTAPKQDWLMAYINSTDNNGSNPMASAASPSAWKIKVDTVIANETALALWIIQEIQAGDMATSYLTANLLTAAGVSSGYTGDGTVTQAKAAIADASKTTSTDVANVSNIETWISALITPTWDASPNTSIATNLANAVTGSVMVTSSATVSGGNITYTLTGADGSSFGVSSSGVVTASNDLAAGSYDFSVVATPAVGTSLTKPFNVSVNTPPTVASFSCGNGFAGASYSCTTPSASDADGDSLTYSLVGAPSWLSIDGSTGALSGNPTSAGAVSGVSISVSDGSDTATSAALSFTINTNPGAALASKSTASTTAQVNDWASFGVSNTMTNDLLNNNTCGSGGNQSCLAAFNAQKVGSSCDLEGGSSATAAQLQSYISCVMIEHHTAVVSTAALGGDSSITAGCSQSVNLALPATCGHPQWSCSMTSAPSSWSLSGANVVVPASYSGSGSQTVSIQMSLGIYTPAYTRTVSKTYNVAAAVSGAANGVKQFNNGSSEDVRSAQNYCRSIGGRLATKSELASLSGSPSRTMFHWTTDDTDITFACPAPYNGRSWACGNTCNHTSGDQPTMIRWSNGGVNCNGSGTSLTIYYACADLPSC